MRVSSSWDDCRALPPPPPSRPTPLLFPDMTAGSNFYLLRDHFVAVLEFRDKEIDRNSSENSAIHGTCKHMHKLKTLEAVLMKTGVASVGPPDKALHIVLVLYSMEPSCTLVETLYLLFRLL